MASRNVEAVAVKAKVLIVDDHPEARAELARQLALEPDLAVCGEADDLTAALALVVKARPHVAIIDIALQNGKWLELIRRIKRCDQAARILVWSKYPEDVYAWRVLRAGAHGYVNKELAPCQVVDAVRAVRQGRLYVNRAVVEQLVPGVARRKPAERSVLDCLSDRELEVFKYIGEGMTRELIAKTMQLSPRTFDTLQARIKAKLGIRSKPELIQRAAQWVRTALISMLPEDQPSNEVGFPLRAKEGIGEGGDAQP
jgi:DNA-binding NarL/FixJ family response regulator